MGIVSATQMTCFMDAATSHIPSERRAAALGFFQAVYGIGVVVDLLLQEPSRMSTAFLAFIVAAFVGLAAGADDLETAGSGCD